MNLSTTTATWTTEVDCVHGGHPGREEGPFPKKPGPPRPGLSSCLQDSTYRTVSFTSPTQSLGGPEVCPTCSEATWSGIKRLWGLWLQPGCTQKLTSPSQPPSTPRKAEPRGTARAPHGVTLSKSSAWWSLSFLICEVGIIMSISTSCWENFK